MSMTWERLGSMLLEETGNTLLMTLPATFFAYLIGLPLGVLLVITRKDGILPKPTLNRIIGVIVNLLRSVPFIILMVMLFPATRAILGRGTGTVSIIIPLTVSAFPYVARMVEGSLLEVDNGVVEAAQAMGSTTFQIVRKVLIPEAMPSLVNGFAPEIRISTRTLHGRVTNSIAKRVSRGSKTLASPHQSFHSPVWCLNK